MNKFCIILHCYASLVNINGVSSTLLSTQPAQSVTTLSPWITSVLQVLPTDFLDGTSSTNNAPLANNSLIYPSVAASKYYAYFALAAYCDSGLKRWSCVFCIALSKQANVTYVATIKDVLLNTFAYVALDHTNKSIVISFRGSINVQNALEDIDFTLTSPWPTNPSIQVSRGFHYAMMTLYSQILLIISQQLTKYPTYRIVANGHSLGGAEASLFVFKIIFEKQFPGTKIELYTYGEPRNGNKAFVTLYNTFDIVAVRVVERADITSHFHPAYFGYYHRSNELWINDIASNSANYCDQDLYEDPTCSSSLGPLGYKLEDHLIYMGLQATTCATEKPIEFVLQLLNPIYAFVPTTVMLLFPASSGFCNPFLPVLNTVSLGILVAPICVPSNLHRLKKDNV